MSNASPSSPNLLPHPLVEGYQTFLSGRFPSEKSRFSALAEKGQTPSVMLISCCDSRVAPETIFDAGPGELFVVRNVAALAPTYQPDNDYHGTSAALEFGVLALRVKHLVVMGHAKCGGVRASAEYVTDPYVRPLSPGDFVGQWLKLLQPALERLGPPDGAVTPEYVEKLVFESIRQSLKNLRTFPWIKTLEDRGLLVLHGAYFSIADGRLLAYDSASDEFRPIAEDSHKAAFAAARF